MRTRLALTCCLLCLVAIEASAQSRRLAIRVEDPSGATIPYAQIIVLAEGAVVADQSADAKGLAVVDVLHTGPLRVIASASGFAATDTSVSIPRGATTHAITIALPIAAIAAEIEVSIEERPGGLTETLGEAEIEQLPDDPDELQLALEELAGPDATIQIDGFTGGRLPTRDQIARIVVRRDAYSAEFHQVGRGRVEIVTRPGLDRWRGHVGLNLRPSRLSARNATTRDTRAGSRLRMNVFAAGPLVPARMSFAAELEGTSSEDVRGVSALAPGGPVAASLTQPFDNRDVSLRTEGLLSDRTMFRARYRRERSDRGNQGISELDLPERGYSRQEVEHELRLSLEGGVRRPFHVRLQLDRTTDAARPDTVAPAIVVQSAFRSGGASVAGEDHRREFASDTMFTLTSRPLALRVGSLVTWVRHEQGQLRNTLGTFTFTDLDSFSARRPATFTQRLDARPIAFAILQGASFVQAELERAGWTVGLGARYEWQRGQADRHALAPRIGVSRAFGRDRISVRAGYGWFFGWIPTRVEEETIRLSQESSEEELIVQNPGYPDPFGAGVTTTRREPPTLVALADDAGLPRWQRASVGVAHRLRQGVRVDFDVYQERTGNDFRSVDLNAPVDGARPDDLFGRMLLLQSIGRSRRTGVNVNLNVSPRDGVFGRLRYGYARSMNDADDPLTPPPGGTFESEWGPSRGDRRHRFNWHLGAPVRRWGLSVFLGGRVLSGTPYDVTTGRDDNGDAIFNDRPAGTSRNTRRGDRHTETDLRVRWTIRPMGSNNAAGVQRPGGGGGPGSGASGRRSRDRRFEMFFSVSNLFNRVNHTSYVGVLSSPLFGRPTSALSARRVELGWRIVF